MLPSAMSFYLLLCAPGLLEEQRPRLRAIRYSGWEPLADARVHHWL